MCCEFVGVVTTFASNVDYQHVTAKFLKIILMGMIKKPRAFRISLVTFEPRAFCFLSPSCLAFINLLLTAC